jgi:hypothetical protein
MAPGYDKYEAFCVKIGPNIENCVNPITVYSIMVILDDEDERYDGEEERNPSDDWEMPMNAQRQGLGPHFSFNLGGPTKAGDTPPIAVIDEEDFQGTTTTANCYIIPRYLVMCHLPSYN